MKKVCLAAACGLALLAIEGSANAQGTGKDGSSGKAANQCWDVANKVVRDVSGTTATGPSGNKNATVGSTTSPGSSSATSGSSATSANANASERPAGIPDC